MVQDLGVLEEFLKVWGCWALVNTDWCSKGMFGCFRMFLGFRDFKSLGLRFRLQGSSSFGFRVVRQFCSFLQIGVARR